jgi:hypothetical protein
MATEQEFRATLDPRMVEGMLNSWTGDTLQKTCVALGFDLRAAFRDFLLSVTQEAWDNHLLCRSPLKMPISDVYHDPECFPPSKPLPMPKTLDELESIARQAHSQRKRPEEIYDQFWSDAERRVTNASSREKERVIGGLRWIARGGMKHLAEPQPEPEPVSVEKLTAAIQANAERDRAARERMEEGIRQGRGILGPAPLAEKTAPTVGG